MMLVRFWAGCHHDLACYFLDGGIPTRPNIHLESTVITSLVHCFVYFLTALVLLERGCGFPMLLVFSHSI